MAIQEGAAPPPFTLQDTQGNEVSLSDFAGKHLILYFYPRDDTPGCTKEACGFRDLNEEITELGAAVVGVSPDSPKAHQKFTDKYGLNFTLLCDPDKSMMSRYGAYGEKIMYGKKTTGVIRSTVWIGPDGKVERHWRRVAKAADHPQKVFEALQLKLSD